MNVELIYVMAGMCAFAGAVVGGMLAGIVVLHDWPFHVVRPRDDR